MYIYKDKKTTKRETDKQNLVYVFTILLFITIHTIVFYTIQYMYKCILHINIQYIYLTNAINKYKYNVQFLLVLFTC